MISNTCLDKFKHSHVFIIIILSFLFQCVSSTTTTPTFLGNQPVAVAINKQIMCTEKERRALLGVKSMILRDPFEICVSKWGTDDDCCNWIGVMCNQSTGHVTELYLDHCGLEGEISPSLLNLTYLTHLGLSYNSFKGTIPMSIGSLTQLRYLDLYSNYFNGTIPSSIGSLTELSYLDLSFNSFSGNIPPEFGNLVNLKSLHLNDIGRCSIGNISWLSRLSHLEDLNMNGISLAKENNWVNAIIGLQNLTRLHLEGCDLSKVMDPYSLSHVNSFSSCNIVDLSLSNNNLNSSMYPWFYPLTSNQLQTLDLSGNKLNEIPKYLGNLCSLASLNFTNNAALVTFSDFLKILSVGCTSDTLENLLASSSQFTGSISDDIQNFSSLLILDIAHNQLNGTISDKLWELPMLDTLQISSNSLRGDIFEKIGKSMLSYMDLSNNLLEGFPFKAQMSNLFNVGYIDLSSCKLGPRFPKWIQTFKNSTSLYHLNIGNTEISDTIPVEFWNMLPYSLYYLNLSSNNISGKATDFLSNFDSSSILDLSSNRFYGPITNVSSALKLLNLSKNKFYGGISFLCQNVDWSLTHLDLSDNSFVGQIPDCLWNLKELRVLNLAHNNLSGRLPASVEYLIQLEVLYLYNNKFSGELPLSLRNCTKLTLLDLGANRFSGNMPVWIGENLSGLYVLSLGSNDFFGPIPLKFCQLVYLQILDLSMNNLNGAIPSCVNNLTSMVDDGVLSTQNIHEYNIPGDRRSYTSFDYADHAMIQWQGTIREFTSNLRLLKSIDLSSNNLTGEIPKELTDLRGLLALNLSKNALLGDIPWAIGHMNELLILDLSRNNCSGEIPPSMSQMTSLYDLDVSYNNLSGRIPPSTQLRSFEASRFIGNVGLCGLPLSKYCPGDEELQVPSTVGEREGGGGEGDIDELERSFYIGGAIGFASGFWIVCTTLLINRRGRHTFFRFLDTLKNWVYVKVAVFKVKFQRTAHG